MIYHSSRIQKFNQFTFLKIAYSNKKKNCIYKVYTPKNNTITMLSISSQPNEYIRKKRNSKEQ